METGVVRLSKSVLQHAVIFDDNTCPYCGSELVIENKELFPRNKGNVSIRFECINCKKKFPIYRPSDNMDKMLPLYDRNRVKEFLRSLEEDY